MSNLGFVQAMRAAGVGVRQTKVGDRYVLEAMKVSGYSLGGEQSGHVIMSEYATTGDGILTALHVLERMATTGQSLQELASVMTRLPQVLVNVTDVDKSRADDDAVLAAAVAEEEAALGDTGRILLRPSGTEPLVRVMVEAATADEARAVAERLAGGRPRAALAVAGLDTCGVQSPRGLHARRLPVVTTYDIRVIDPGRRGRSSAPGGRSAMPRPPTARSTPGRSGRSPGARSRWHAPTVAWSCCRRTTGSWPSGPGCCSCSGTTTPTSARSTCTCAPSTGAAASAGRCSPSSSGTRRRDGRTVIIGTRSRRSAREPGIAVRGGERLPRRQRRGDQGRRPEGGARALAGAGRRGRGRSR